jgi:hypothetical protein
MQQSVSTVTQAVRLQATRGIPVRVSLVGANFKFDIISQAPWVGVDGLELAKLNGQMLMYLN